MYYKKECVKTTDAILPSRFARALFEQTNLQGV